MIFTLIVDNASIDRADNEPFVMLFYSPYHTAKESEDAVRRAVYSFLMTEKGQAAITHNCGSFNWGDVSCYVPDHYFHTEGLIPIPSREECSSVVDRDEELTHSGSYTVKSTVELILEEGDIAALVEKAFSGLNAYSFWLEAMSDKYDWIYDCLFMDQVLEVKDTETRSHTYQLTVSNILDGLRRWHESGYAAKGAVLEDGRIDVDSISAEDADRILQFALFGEIKFEP